MFPPGSPEEAPLRPQSPLYKDRVPGGAVFLQFWGHTGFELNWRHMTFRKVVKTLRGWGDWLWRLECLPMPPCLFPSVNYIKILKCPKPLECLEHLPLSLLLQGFTSILKVSQRHKLKAFLPACGHWGWGVLEGNFGMPALSGSLADSWLLGGEDASSIWCSFHDILSCHRPRVAKSRDHRQN